MPVRLIYLHGFASGPGSQKARFFQQKFAELGHKLLVPDLAAGDFEHLTLTGQLAVIHSVAEGAPCILIGSSMGGYLAALYAARHAEVERVVLMAPAFGFIRRWPGSFGSERMEEWRRTGYIEVFHYGKRQNRRLGYQLFEDGSCYEDYPDMKQPALLFHGDRDDAVPLRYSQEFCAQHQNATLQVLESDHELLDMLPHMWEQSRHFLLEGRPPDPSSGPLHGGIR